MVVPSDGYWPETLTPTDGNTTLNFDRETNYLKIVTNHYQERGNTFLWRGTKTGSAHQSFTQSSSSNKHFGEETGKSRTENDHANDKQAGNNFGEIDLRQTTHEKCDNHQAYQQSTDGSKIDSEVNKTTTS